MSNEKRHIDEVMEEYNRLHHIPHDVTDSVAHSEFVAGVKDGSIGFKVMRGEAIAPRQQNLWAVCGSGSFPNV